MSHNHLFYRNQPSPCSYLKDRSSVSLFCDPFHQPQWRTYDQLIQYGFRRSGDHIYRPDCNHCQACIPLRLRVCDFKPGRRFRRIIRKNQDLALSQNQPAYTDEYFSLYQHYLCLQHANGGMDEPTSDDFMRFLVTDWSHTLFLEFRHHKQLLAVAVTDQMSTGLSSVYTFYDATFKQRGLGNLAILSQIQLCRELALPYLYLGYWIRDCRKMTYKNDFQPVEYFIGGEWLTSEEFKAGAGELK